MVRDGMEARRAARAKGKACRAPPQRLCSLFVPFLLIDPSTDPFGTIQGRKVARIPGNH
jgi:hypothetical protein